MIPTSETLLKTQQVAHALGVGVSTIKRWVDSGEIRARKTVGGHRLIALADVLRFARERGLLVSGLESPREGGPEPTASDGGAILDALTTALKRGRVKEAKALIRRARVEGLDAAALADEILRPAMETIGHDWEVGNLDVYQEHRASRVVEAALIDLLQRTLPEPGPSAPSALGAAPEGDHYTLSGLLCELTLRELGWDVMNLGANLPLASLAKAVRVHHPRLVWLTIHHLADRERFATEYKQFYASASVTGTAVILGGPGLTPDLRAELVAASFGERLVHLAEFARRLGPAWPRPGPDAGSIQR